MQHHTEHATATLHAHVPAAVLDELVSLADWLGVTVDQLVTTAIREQLGDARAAGLIP